jgi:phosphate starvation-inducible PhoH-like protein
MRKKVRDLPEVHWRTPQDEELKAELQHIADDKTVKPKTANHERYFNAIQTSVVTFCIGPAGTGKTYIACGIAAEMLKQGKVDKIVIARPLVECGNSRIGALPGELKDKVDPYMRPVMDAFGEFFTPGQLKKHVEEGRIVIAPLEYMRGMTYKRTFMILDEAQNVKDEQMLMWLTRIGEGTIQVICGDIEQIDLPRHINSGLETALHRLKDPSIARIRLTDDDVMRAGIVRTILKQWYAK